MSDDAFSIRSEFGPRLTVLARRWRSAVDKRLATLDLSDATWPPLYHLYASGDAISQKQLAARVGLDESTLVRLMVVLEKKGFIERTIDEADRRLRIIVLTPSGRLTAGSLLTELRQVESDLLTDIPDSQLLAALHAFDAIEATLARG